LGVACWGTGVLLGEANGVVGRVGEDIDVDVDVGAGFVVEVVEETELFG
jgi:hypothetical protein